MVKNQLFLIYFDLFMKTKKNTPYYWGILFMERETGFEPATFSLARRRSSQLSYSRKFMLNVPSLGIEPRSHVFQTCAVTNLASLAAMMLIYSSEFF